MSHSHATKVRQLEEAIAKELQQEKKEPIIGNAVTKWLTPVRKRFARIFNPAITNPEKADLSLLPEYHQQQYENFENARAEYRPLGYHYAAQYRGSYILNYILAAFAVALAVLSFFLLYATTRMSDEHTKHAFHIIVFGLGIVKFFLLLVITINTRQANRIDFNHRAITYRYIMEQLRCMSYLSIAGISSTPQSSASQYMSGKWRNNYIERHIRDKIREVLAISDQSGKEKTQEINYNKELVPILKFIQADWITPQINYHTQKYTGQNSINDRLEKYVNILNAIVLGTVFIDIAWVSLLFFHLIPAGATTDFNDWGTPAILMLATIIPVLVASFNGIRFQTEARKIGERSQIMAVLLQEFYEEYDKLIVRIENLKTNPEYPGSFTGEAQDLINKTAQLMINEVTEWTFIYSREVLDT